jgi:hypothetical protein
MHGGVQQICPFRRAGKGVGGTIDSRTGTDVEVLETGSPQVLAFTRTTGDGKSLLVVANLSEQAVSEYGVKQPAASGGVQAQDDLIGVVRVNAWQDGAYKPVGELKPQQVLVVRINQGT